MLALHGRVPGRGVRHLAFSAVHAHLCSGHHFDEGLVMYAANVRRTFTAAGLLGLVATISACDIIPGTGPDDNTQYQFFSEVTLPEFEQLVQEGSARVEVIISEDGMAAREVEVRSGASLENEEEIVSRVASIGPEGDARYLVLDLGGLVVDFNEETTFRKGDDEMSFEQFVGYVSESVAFDEAPTIKAERAPRDLPQDPSDTAFTALRISVIGNEHAQEIDINIDPDNLLLNDGPPPDGWIHVLGLMIELRVSEGITQIHSERDDLEKKEFEGKVKSVSADLTTFTLENNTVVRIVDDTKIAYEQGDKHRLGSLADVAAALEDGKEVFSAGYGIVEGNGPLQLAAVHVVFEIAAPKMEGFEGYVDSVDVTAGTLVLSNGRVIEITDGTNIKHEAESDLYLTSLAAVEEALAAGETVVAWGEGDIVKEEPLTIRAACIVLKLVPPPSEDFEGEVASVNEADGTVTLTNEIVVLITDDTEFKQEAGYLTSFSALVEAFAAGENLVGWGEGIVESENPLTIRAGFVAFKLAPPPLESFEGTVLSVDVDGGSLTLTDGTIICVTDATKITYEEGDVNRLPSLQAVSDAVTAGTTVYTAGEGVVKGDGPPQIEAKQIVFEI